MSALKVEKLEQQVSRFALALSGRATCVIASSRFCHGRLLKSQSCPKAAKSILAVTFLPQLRPVVQPLPDLALEAALGRIVELLAAERFREVVLARERVRRVVVVVVAARRSLPPSSAWSAHSGCASAAAASRPPWRPAWPRHRPCRRRSISARSPHRSPPARSRARPRAMPRKSYASFAALQITSACGSASPMSSTAMRTTRRAR